jgi:hypothetical protein
MDSPAALAQNARMRRSIGLLALLSSTLAGGSAFAQAEPSDVDLQSAYCIRVVLTQVQFMTDALAKSSPADPSYAGTQEMLRKRRTDLQRMQNYLAPRLSWLDVQALAEAGKHAEQDLYQNASIGTQCVQKCGPQVVDGQPAPEWPACIEQCTDTPITQRLAGCREVDWVP